MDDAAAGGESGKNSNDSNSNSNNQDSWWQGLFKPAKADIKKENRK